MKIREWLLIFILIGHFPCFTLNGQKDLQAIIMIPWNEPDGIFTKQSNSGNFGIEEYQIVAENTLLIYSDSENKIKLFNIQEGDCFKEFELKYPGLRIEVDRNNNIYYVFRERFIDIYCQDGILTKSIEIDRRIRFPNRLISLNNSLYVLTSDYNTYTIIDNGQVLGTGEQVSHSNKGWILNDGEYCSKIAIYGNKLSFNIIDKDKRSSNFTIIADSACIACDPIGIIGDKLILLAYYQTADSPGELTQILLEYSLSEQKIVSNLQTPQIFFVSIKNEYKIYNNLLYHLLTTPDGAILFCNCDKVKSDGRILNNYKYPDNLNYKYHFNNYLIPDSLPYSVPKDQTKKKSEESLNCGTNEAISTSQIITNASVYPKIEWWATSTNFPLDNASLINIDTDIGGGYKVQVPSWISISTTEPNQSVPYKWGGWTQARNWLQLVEDGKITGDISTESPYDTDDSRVIGLDCSGLVTRAWNINPKQSTSDLPNKSTMYSNKIDTQPGDALINPGVHARLVVQNNGTTFSVIESIKNNFNKVIEQSYQLSELSGYNGYKYQQKSNINLVHNGLNFDQMVFIQGLPMSFSFTVENKGSSDYNGFIRACVYARDNEYDDDLGVPLFQIGTEQPLNLSSNSSLEVSMAMSVLPILARGFYVLALEYSTGSCWEIIPSFEYIALREIAYDLVYITGSAYDRYGNPIANSQVVSSTGERTSTDAYGFYSLYVPYHSSGYIWIEGHSEIPTQTFSFISNPITLDLLEPPPIAEPEWWDGSDVDLSHGFTINNSTEGEVYYCNNQDVIISFRLNSTFVMPPVEFQYIPCSDAWDCSWLKQLLRLCVCSKNKQAYYVGIHYNCDEDYNCQDEVSRWFLDDHVITPKYNDLNVSQTLDFDFEKGQKYEIKIGQGFYSGWKESKRQILILPDESVNLSGSIEGTSYKAANNMSVTNTSITYPLILESGKNITIGQNTILAPANVNADFHASIDPQLKSAFDDCGLKSQDNYSYISQSEVNRSNVTKLVSECNLYDLSAEVYPLNDEIIQQPSLKGIIINPNPTADKFIVATSNPEELLIFISLINLSGEILSYYSTKSLREFQISTADFMPGVYIVRVVTNKSLYSYRLLRY